MTIGMITGAIIGLITLLSLLVKFTITINKSVGKDAAGRTISDRLDRVEHQLWENGGSSLADRVNSISDLTIKMSAEVELVKDILLANQGLNLQHLPMTEEPKIRKTRQRKTE